jgi:hypothetical protein
VRRPLVALVATVGLALPALAGQVGAQQRDSTTSAEPHAAPKRGGISALRLGAGLAAAPLGVAPFHLGLKKPRRATGHPHTAYLGGRARIL